MTCPLLPPSLRHDVQVLSAAASASDGVWPALRLKGLEKATSDECKLSSMQNKYQHFGHQCLIKQSWNSWISPSAAAFYSRLSQHSWVKGYGPSALQGQETAKALQKNHAIGQKCKYSVLERFFSLDRLGLTTVLSMHFSPLRQKAVVAD